MLICGTYVLPQLRQFGGALQGKLADKKLYRVSIRGMRLRLEELQVADKQAKKIKVEKLGRQDWENIDRVLHHQGLP